MSQAPNVFEKFKFPGGPAATAKLRTPTARAALGEPPTGPTLTASVRYASFDVAPPAKRRRRAPGPDLTDVMSSSSSDPDCHGSPSSRNNSDSQAPGGVAGAPPCAATTLAAILTTPLAMNSTDAAPAIQQIRATTTTAAAAAPQPGAVASPSRTRVLPTSTVPNGANSSPLTAAASRPFGAAAASTSQLPRTRSAPTLTAGSHKGKNAKGAGAARAKATAAVAADGSPRGVPEKLGDQPLRLIIVGHNPSEHAWRSGHYYSNPSNHMWRILISTGIAPTGTRGAEDDDRMPAAAGVGFLDVGCGHPGTDSSSFKSEIFVSWSRAFYSRLRAHMERASTNTGCTCSRCGAPSLVAFSGKRQFLELLNVGRMGKNKVKTVEVGPQALLPSGWPFPPSTEVWVCSSTSGAAVLTREEREGPYVRLAERLREIEWPRRVQLRCGERRVSGAARGAAGQAAGGGDSGTAEEASD